MVWYLPQIFRGNRAASTKYTPQGRANREVVPNVRMKFSPAGNIMEFSTDGQDMHYGSVNN